MKPEREILERLYVHERQSSHSIAAHFGVTHTTVARWLRECGIALRPSGRGLAQRGETPPSADELYRLLHVEGKDYRAIGALYGVTHRTVILWARGHGIESPPKRNARMAARPVPSADELRELYEAGLSMRVIGNLYGVDKTVIRRLCTEYGLEVRYGGWDGGKRFACDDGHLVKSSYELKVDNWLHAQGVAHIYEPPMPGNPRYHADFLANGWYVEVWGTSGSREYIERRNRKRALYRLHAVPLIEIGFHAFYPKGTDLWSRQLARCLTTVPEQSTQLRADLLDE